MVMASATRHDVTESRKIAYKTYNDINRTSVTALNSICRDFNIDTSLPKTVKVNAVCHCLSISTTGDSHSSVSLSELPGSSEALTKSQLQELRSLTPKVLYTLTDWSADLSDLPSISDADVKRFLLQSEVLNASSERTYKLSRPYQLRQFVNAVQVCSVASFYVIRARCLPSQSTDKDEVKLMHIIIDRHTGQPYGGYCTCTVGCCQSCGHIGAALFCLSDWIASGLTRVPDQLACTDVLCQWKDPRGAHVDPVTISDMKRRKSATRQTRADYTPPPPAPLNPDAVCHLRGRLLNAIPECVIPAAHALASDRFAASDVATMSPSYVPITDLPDTADMLAPSVAFSSEIDVTSYPLPIAYLHHKSFDSTKCTGYEDERQRFIQCISYTDEDRAKIAHITEGQSQNCEWFNQRMGSLTASKFGAILRFMASGRKKADGIIRNIQNYRQRGLTTVPATNVPSLKWGLKCESVACKAYEAFIKSHHTNLSLTKTGLCVSATAAYLRASPDAIVSCECHRDRWLLEIKCPWTLRNMDPAEAADSGAFKYLQKVDSKYTLVPCAATGYFEQVQGTMAVTELTHCHFVIWTLRGMLIIPVEFDRKFWASAKCELQKFFETFIVGEILTERVWRALPLFDDDDFASGGLASDSRVDDAACVVGLQEFDDDVVLEDDIMEDSFFQGLQLPPTSSALMDASISDDVEMGDEETMYFDISDFETEETVNLN